MLPIRSAAKHKGFAQSYTPNHLSLEELVDMIDFFGVMCRTLPYVHDASQLENDYDLRETKLYGWGPVVVPSYYSTTKQSICT